MTISWTYAWSSSDDGSVFGGADLQNIQNNVSTYTCHLSGTQTVTGNKTFSGTSTFSGTATVSGSLDVTGSVSAGSIIPQISKIITWENDMVVYENELVVIQL